MSNSINLFQLIRWFAQEACFMLETDFVWNERYDEKKNFISSNNHFFFAIPLLSPKLFPLSNEMYNLH